MTKLERAKNLTREDLLRIHGLPADDAMKKVARRWSFVRRPSNKPVERLASDILRRNPLKLHALDAEELVTYVYELEERLHRFEDAARVILNPPAKKRTV